MDPITFRTNDATRWGTGQGSDLTATQIDINFWVLYTMLLSIQDHQDASAGIASITVSGTQMFVNLTNHVQLGPFTLPQAQWNFRGTWQSGQQYNINDVFTQQGVVYLVTFANFSTAPFTPFANDGSGHNFYAVLLAAPPPLIPVNGAQGQFLQWTLAPNTLPSPNGEPWNWVNTTRNIAFYLETPPEPLEVVCEYIVVEQMSFPAGFTNPTSRAYARFSPTVEQTYEIYQNGANIGSINFTPSPSSPFFTGPATDFEPGDVIEIIAPSVPDPHMTNIAVTLVAILT